MRVYNRVIPSKHYDANISPPILEVAEGFVVDYSISPQKRIKELRRAIRQAFPGEILEVERGLWKYFTPLVNESKTTSIGCYFPEEEYWLQSHQGLDHNNPEFLMLAESCTSMMIEQNLSALGLRSATLEELIEFVKDDPSSALFGGFVAMGTSKETKEGKYFPAFQLAVHPQLTFVSQFVCHVTCCPARSRMTYQTKFLVVPL